MSLEDRIFPRLCLAELAPKSVAMAAELSLGKHKIASSEQVSADAAPVQLQRWGCDWETHLEELCKTMKRLK